MSAVFKTFFFVAFGAALCVIAYAISINRFSDLQSIVVKFGQVVFQSTETGKFAALQTISARFWEDLLETLEFTPVPIGKRLEFRKLSNGALALGSFRDGEQEGLGIVVFPDHSRYHGNFLHGLQDGEGTYFYSDGSIYTGSWRKGERSGKGMLRTATRSYRGDFERDKKQGEGVMVDSDGTVYQGHFEAGTFSKGIIRWPWGDIYQGTFVKYILNGPGRLTRKWGNTDAGIFVDGTLNGFGCRIYPDGSKIVGEFLNGRPTIHHVLVEGDLAASPSGYNTKTREYTYNIAGRRYKITFH